jgi:hypothetical protein
MRKTALIGKIESQLLQFTQEKFVLGLDSRVD